MESSVVALLDDTIHVRSFGYLGDGCKGESPFHHNEIFASIEAAGCAIKTD
jgi:hypothetical protein